MEKARTGPDPLPPPSDDDDQDAGHDKSPRLEKSESSASSASSVSSRAKKRPRMDAEARRRNRLLGVEGRDELVRAGQKCVMCLEEVSLRVDVVGVSGLGLESQGLWVRFRVRISCYCG